MKKLATFVIGFIVSIPLGLAGQDETFFPYSFARMSYVKGDVYVQRTSDLGYERGEVNLALVQGDKMGTERGQAEIHFGRRNYLRLDEDTRVEFAFLPREDEEYIKIHLLEGRAYLRISALVEDKGVEVHTPDASFYVLEEGLFRFDVSPDRVTEAFVHEGSLEAASEAGSVLIRSLESVAASNGRLLGDPDYFYSRRDAFDDWNNSRDSLLARRGGRTYLPAALDEYEEELDRHGNWVYERPYGYVWVPVVHEAYWQPYYYGRWVWYPVIGWKWVSSEPWGWAVYHYGRWHWRVGLGWYWIPHHHWRPAWVHWWWSGNYIGWCPLSWYNRPIVVINNYFYDRHFDSYSPARNRALTVIHRNQLQAPNVHRHQIAAPELERISKVALKAQQPSIRPVVNNAGPQAVEARRVLSPRPGAPSGPRMIAPSDSVSASGLSPRGGAPGSKAPPRGSEVSTPGVRRGALSEAAVGRPPAGGGASSERAIRAYPSQRTAGLREQSGASDRGATSLDRKEPAVRSGSQDAPARVSPPVRQTPPATRTESGSAAQKMKKEESRSSGTAVKKGETIKNYPSGQVSQSAALSPRSSSSVRAPNTRPSGAESADPSRLNQRDHTAASRQSLGVSSRTSAGSRPAVSRSPGGFAPGNERVSSLPGKTSSSRQAPRAVAPSSRTVRSSSISSRPGVSRPAVSPQPRTSLTSPSRSSGRSVAPSSSPRPSASSAGRSASSSSSSRSSSSGSSGGVRKKG